MDNYRKVILLNNWLLNFTCEDWNCFGARVRVLAHACPGTQRNSSGWTAVLATSDVRLLAGNCRVYIPVPLNPRETCWPERWRFSAQRMRRLWPERVSGSRWVRPCTLRTRSASAPEPQVMILKHDACWGCHLAEIVHKVEVPVKCCYEYYFMIPS